MKTSHDPRHLERIRLMQELFSWQFNPKEDQAVLNPKTKEIISQIETINTFIKSAAPSWPIEKINRVDLAILRLAVYELLIEKKAPTKVILDEAIELAKAYGSDSSASFVNGSLGKLISTP